MARFTSSTRSEAVVSADRHQVWALLTDPDELPALTPMLESIQAHGDLWHWQMSRIPVLGVSIAPSFTEQMKLDPENRIDFTHAPPYGVHERAAAEGSYVLTDVGNGTRLEIALELCVELPLPRASRPAVVRVMDRVVALMGDRFSANLLKRLGAAQL